MQSLVVGQGGQEGDQTGVCLGDPERSSCEMWPVGLGRRKVGEQRLRDIPALESRRGGQFDAWKFGKIGFDGGAYEYGSGSRDDGGVGTTTPFCPGSIIDCHAIATKTGQRQSQNRRRHARPAAGNDRAIKVHLAKHLLEVVHGFERAIDIQNPVERHVERTGHVS